MPGIFEQSESLRERVAAKLLEKIPNLESAIYNRIWQLLEQYEQKGGRFIYSDTSAAQIIEIQNEIERILKEAGYFRAASIYVADLGLITQNTIALQAAVNGINVPVKALSGIQKAFATTVRNTLAEGGLNANFILPVTTAINEALTFGYSIENTRKNLADMILGEPEKLGKLESYLTVTARDTVTQMQGAQHQAVANELDMPWIRYVGGLLKDSRGQCVRWHGMEYLAVADLEEEIALAFKNQEAKKVDGPHRWSGMIKDTTPENFLIRRGGWGCLHQAVPVRRNPKARK